MKFLCAVNVNGRIIKYHYSIYIDLIHTCSKQPPTHTRLHTYFDTGTFNTTPPLLKKRGGGRDFNRPSLHTVSTIPI